MSDPYSVLGVSRSASNDEIKKVYRKLCRQYHPDANIDNPNKAQYEEKFKQIGEAYRLIMEERSGKTSSYGYSDTSSTSDSRLNAAAVYIQRGYFREAVNTLNSITDRNAMWYYLSAVANARLGNNIIAREHAKEAARMEPGNSAYQNLAASLNGEGAFYQEYRTRGADYGRQFNFDMDYCVRCCAINAALNLCCGVRCCYC